MLTDLTLQKLVAPETGQREVWDGKIPGFGVRISANGAKSFILMYRHNGKARRWTLGRYPDLTLAKARQRAQKALGVIIDGKDPQAAAQMELPNSPLRFGNLLVEFIETHCKRHNKASTAKETERILRSDFLPAWALRDVSDLQKSDVLRTLDRLVREGTPSAANHAFSAIRKFFNWCVQRSHITSSPCAGIQSPAKHRSRERVLADDELSAIWMASSEIGYPAEPIVRLLILTAQRRGEVAGMRWQDLDLDVGVWSMPAELTKANRAHSVPLTPMALTIILSLPRANDQWVFPSKKVANKSWEGFTKAKWRLDDRLGFTDWTLHDFRRTAATGLARLKVAPHVVEKILNHSSGTFAGVAGVYNRFAYVPEMREALEQWSSFVEQLIHKNTTSQKT